MRSCSLSSDCAQLSSHNRSMERTGSAALCPTPPASPLSCTGSATFCSTSQFLVYTSQFCIMQLPAVDIDSQGRCKISTLHMQVQNFVRPLRFSVAIAIAPLFDRFITSIQKVTGWSRRNAFGAFLFLLGSGTSLLVFGSIAVLAGPLAFAR